MFIMTGLHIEMKQEPGSFLLKFQMPHNNSINDALIIVITLVYSTKKNMQYWLTLPEYKATKTQIA